MGLSIRFYPEDILNILPIIFNDKKFSKNNNSKRLMNGILIYDKYFQQFYKDLTNKQNTQFPLKYDKFPYISNKDLVFGYMYKYTQHIDVNVACLIVQIYNSIIL